MIDAHTHTYIHAHECMHQLTARNAHRVVDAYTNMHIECPFLKKQIASPPHPLTRMHALTYYPLTGPPPVLQHGPLRRDGHGASRTHLTRPCQSRLDTTCPSVLSILPPFFPFTTTNDNDNNNDKTTHPSILPSFLPLLPPTTTTTTPQQIVETCCVLDLPVPELASK